jgi:hypothetical protein
VTTTYDVRSTVLGGLVVESLDGNGAKTAGYAYNPAGGLLATDNGQTAIYSTEDPQHTSEQTSWSVGRDAGRTEYDPVGADAGTYNFYQDQPQPDRDLPEHSGVMSEPADGCLADGMADDCRAMALLAASGAQVYFSYQRQASFIMDYNRKTGQAGYTQTIHTLTKVYDPADLDQEGNVRPGAVPVDSWLSAVPMFTPFDLDGLELQKLTHEEVHNFEMLPTDRGRIRVGLWGYMLQPRCTSFISNLLSRVATWYNPVVPGNILDVFDMVTAQKNGIVRAALPGGGEARGSIGDNDAQIALAPARFGRSYLKVARKSGSDAPPR